MYVCYSQLHVTVSYMLQFFLLISSNRKLLSERRLNKSILEVDERDEWKGGIITFWNGAYSAISRSFWTLIGSCR